MGSEKSSSARAASSLRVRSSSASDKEGRIAKPETPSAAIANDFHVTSARPTLVDSRHSRRLPETTGPVGTVSVCSKRKTDESPDACR